MLMYGTAWKEERTEQLVSQALEAGYRAIDTANQRKHYYEAGVGAAVARAIDAGLVTRDALHLQTKFTFLNGQDERLPYDRNASVFDQVQQSFATSLEHLRTSYVDSFILHGPSRRRGLAEADRDAWRSMEALVERGVAKKIGVSNVTLEQLELLHDFARIKPAYVQNRSFAATRWDAEVREFCTRHAVTYQGFSLLTANRRELSGTRFRRIAAESGRTAAQVVFRFALQVGMLPLTGTTSEEHMREDLQLDFALDEATVRAIECIGEENA